MLFRHSYVFENTSTTFPHHLLWQSTSGVDIMQRMSSMALAYIIPRLVDYLIATRSHDMYTSAFHTSQSQAMDHNPEVKAEENQPPPVPGKGDHTPSASASPGVTAPPSNSSDISDASDFEDEAEKFFQSLSTDEELIKLMDQLSTTVDSFRIIQIIDCGINLSFMKSCQSFSVANFSTSWSFGFVTT